MRGSEELAPTEGETGDFNADRERDGTTGGDTGLASTETYAGFETLDDVQRYAIGALAVALLNRDVSDLNEVAFARTQCIGIMEALNIGKRQQEGLLSLNPTQDIHGDLVAQCVSLIGDCHQRSHALHTLLALSVASGTYDARSRAFITAIAYHFGISWPTVAAVELSLAVHLCNVHSIIAGDDVSETANVTSNTSSAPDMTTSDTDLRRSCGFTKSALPGCNNVLFKKVASVRMSCLNMQTSVTKSEGLDLPEIEDASESLPPSIGQVLIQRRKQKQHVLKLMKIGGITLVGGMVFGLTGGIIAPALLPALAGIGLSGAASLAASGTFASGAVVGGLFGVAGGGFTLRKACRRVRTNLDEFYFERANDPRVIEERSRKIEQSEYKTDVKVEECIFRGESQHFSIGMGYSSGLSLSASDDRTTFELASLQSPPWNKNDLNRFELGGEDSSKGKSSSKKQREFGKHSKKKLHERKVDTHRLEDLATVPSLHVCICVPAWLTDRGFGSSLDQFESALKSELPHSQHIALRWESVKLYEMGLAFAKFWASKATVTTVQQTYPHALAAASTVAGAVAFAFAIPLTVMSCMDYIDNPWSVLVSRSNGAGEELADFLVERSYGNRPVTLFGYSIGARVVFKCLECLASRGALGIVDNAFFVGAAVTADPERWRRVRKVVAGRLVNAYGSHDWALAFFHRGCGHGVYVSGLRRVELDGVENMNMAYLGVEGHRELKDGVPRLMRGMGVGLGYISLPPAKLVLKGKKIEGNAVFGEEIKEVAVCEEPDEMGCMTTESPSMAEHFSVPLSKNDFEYKMNLSHKALIDSDVAEDLNNGTKPFATDTIEAEAEVKLRKSKWKSWNGWRKSTVNANKKQSYKSSCSSSCVEDKICVDVPIQPVQRIDMSESAKSRTVEKKVASFSGDYMLDVLGEDLSASGNIDNVDLSTTGKAVPFDWCRQHEIWDEQERQMKAIGCANAAAEIELQNKVTLNFSVEVAGRRLELFIKQDSIFPVPSVERIFTNCVEDQLGMHIRVYEHEHKTKMLAVNMAKNMKRYPKLITEMEIQLKHAAPKGKLRVAISIAVDENGTLNGWAEERFGDGSYGERVLFSVERSDLCSPSERIELDEVEKRQIEAMVEQCRHQTETDRCLALPSPAISSSISGTHSSTASILDAPLVPVVERCVDSNELR